MEALPGLSQADPSAAPELLRFLRRVYPLPDADFAQLVPHLRLREASKGELLARVGQVQRELLFVREGIQMGYFEADDKAHVVAFTYPPALCAVPESFLPQQPSPTFLQCLTASRFVAIRHEALQAVMDESQAVERTMRLLTEALLIGTLNRQRELVALPIRERFRAFAARSGPLLGQIPHRYLASYLNIDPTNFSKLFNSVRI